MERISDKYRDDKTRDVVVVADEESVMPRSRPAVASRRSNSMIFVLISLIVLGMWGWITCYQLGLDTTHPRSLAGELELVQASATGGHFDGKRIQELDGRLIPGGDVDPNGERRLVFVGDIHGCADELKKLLKRVDFDEQKDHLIAVGDVISKGPKNAEVLDELIRLEATSVRGNHEDRILDIAPRILGSDEPELVTELASNGADKDKDFLRRLSTHHLKYLRAMPLVLRIPPLPRAHHATSKATSPIAEEILVVHAGLVPAVPLAKQKPYYVMNMRSMHTRTHEPMVDASSKKSRTRPWHEIWGWYNERLLKHKSLKGFRNWVADDEEPEDDVAEASGLQAWWGLKKRVWPKPQVVVYGHHSKAGLHVERWSKGLDTGCVRGGKLTALVLNAHGKQDVVSVGCEDHRE